MKRRTFQTAVAAACLAAGFAASAPALAQTGGWPNKPVRLVVPFPAGGSTDVVARFIAQGLSDKFGQSFVVDNRGGAGGNIGTDAVAKAAPDGYTIGLSTSGPLVNNKFLYKNMPFDSDKDLAPIALVCEIPLVIASTPKVSAKNLKEFIQQAKAKPDAYTVGQPGNGTIGHLALEQLSMVTNTKLSTVAYRGDTPLMTDLLGANIQGLSAPITAFIPNLASGKLNGLAVTSATRFPGLPNIPTAKEQGIDMVATVWFAVVGPAGTPPEVIKALNTEINNIVSSTYGKAKLQTYGAVVNVGAPDLLRKMINEDSKKWQKVISTANVKLD
ncbi:Bug family tripartite tricarboxylate transporter substrate binding protein [Hydrogenophaga sp. BPS33]|uniref:Bug family tripartite tricarboxylate transporter substrate binding protein n=1 Tax=Hydrogenophaga sp. BPS33 TaxID=2651974 RepID=UPI0013202EC2|nr:tripartite tricarboxylate transporter substrate binding protein [Hydrogenophaga sp. BPS33]QHE88919.1 tripartite tricarboxylate transporter substrate binding protein [Hydrogenophaga sp. BPS33]